jgi:hypothetical protein
MEITCCQGGQLGICNTVNGTCGVQPDTAEECSVDEAINSIVPGTRDVEVAETGGNVQSVGAIGGLGVVLVAALVHFVWQ